MNYNDLVRIKLLYDGVDKETIKENIRKILAQHNMKTNKLTEIIGFSNHAAYSYTKHKYGSKPDLFNLLILASFFNVDVEYYLT